MPPTTHAHPQPYHTAITQKALYSKYKKLRQKLEFERGEEVTDEELAPLLKVCLCLGV